MNNREWLYSLDVADLADWFDAEHVENQELALDGDTAALEAEYGKGGLVGGSFCDTPEQGEVVMPLESWREYLGTESENEDSCDKLEADVRKIAEAYNMDTQRHGTERFAHELYHSIIHLLDRQAALTDAEWDDELEQLHMGYKPLIDGLQAQVDELTAERDMLENERDNLEAKCDGWNKHVMAIENAYKEALQWRDEYRSKFGKCIDYADAIHALMDDEGMA